MIILRLFSALVLLACLAGVPHARAQKTYGGIVFPGGDSSFADSVLRYAPTWTPPVGSNYSSPSDALGPPNYTATPAPAKGAVSLGENGIIELLFTNNLLTNSGSSMADLHVFEIGGVVESTFVAIRPLAATALLLGDPSLWDPNGDGFYELGRTSGGTSSLDIDAIFTGYAIGVLKFDAVQLRDDPSQVQVSAVSPGADIDAVGAITSLAIIPEPSPQLLLTLGGALYVLRRRRRGVR